MFVNSRAATAAPRLRTVWSIVPICAVGLAVLASWLGGPLAARADNLQTVGATKLRAADPTLVGTGVTVGQAEAQETGTNDWEVVPPLMEGEPGANFTWFNTNGSSTNIPNDLGILSYHAINVANIYYGTAEGIAPGVSNVNNYEADYYYQYVIALEKPETDQVVNQSFIFQDVPDQPALDTTYDNYSDTTGILLCSAVGNGGPVYAPGTAYNSIGVGSYGPAAQSSTGPTPDNGRSKPDIVTPAVETSFACPFAAGAAAVLIQAATRGDGGSNISAATDQRTIKALLLNGAVKPFGWTNTTTAPLDVHYGAGLLNLFYAYGQLSAGQQAFSASTTVSSGSAHPPGGGTPLPSLLGWDFQKITTSLVHDTINHYYFAPGTGAASNFTLTATLVWNRGLNQTSVSQLGLFLYNSTSGALVDSSVSTVDNVQHLYIPQLPAGSYDLQAVKFGGLSQSVSASEEYALAFQFYPVVAPGLSIASSGGAASISWPVSPTIFTLQQTASLSPPVSWSALPNAQWITNEVVLVSTTPSATATFYRLVAGQ